jgi:hypothetical protein
MLYECLLTVFLAFWPMFLASMFDQMRERENSRARAGDAKYLRRLGLTRLSLILKVCAWQKPKRRNKIVLLLKF